MVDGASLTCLSSLKGKNRGEAIPKACEGQFTLRGIPLYYLGGTNAHLKNAHEDRTIFNIAGGPRPALRWGVSRQVHNPTLQNNPIGFGAPTGTQLLEYMTDVDLHRALGNVERRTDFFVRLASHH